MARFVGLLASSLALTMAGASGGCKTTAGGKADGDTTGDTGDTGGATTGNASTSTTSGGPTPTTSTTSTSGDPSTSSSTSSGGSTSSTTGSDDGDTDTDGGMMDGCQGDLVIDRQVLSVVPPAGVQVQFRLLCDDQKPVRPLLPTDVSILNDEKKDMMGRSEPFGTGGEGGGQSKPGIPNNIEQYSILMLDMSDSIFNAGALDDVIDGALQFVDDVVTKQEEARLRHRVAIWAFGSTSRTERIVDYTQDGPTLIAALESLRTSTSRGTTNLYGAYVRAIDDVNAQTGASLDTILERVAVVLTDGTHEAGDEANQRLIALGKRSEARQAQTSVYTLGIAGNYDQSKLLELASEAENFINVEDATVLAATFSDVSARAEALARSNYVVGVCTPVELGNPTMTIEVNVDGKSVVATIPYSSTYLTGEVNSCDTEALATGFVDNCFAGNDNCTLFCGKMNCGIDNGRSCGSCETDHWCDVTVNVCVDGCTAVECGMGDMGSDCGSCDTDMKCSMAQTCVPECMDLECGAGPKGGDCGTCMTAGEFCSSENLCIAEPLSIDIYNRNACAVLSDGNVRCWGNYTTGVLGPLAGEAHGDNEEVYTGGDIDLGGPAKSVQLGDDFACAQMQDDTIRCWGLGNSGQIGLGHSTFSTYFGDTEALTDEPAIPVGGDGTIKSFSVGDAHVCVVRNDDEVLCWGAGGGYRLGYGDTTSRGLSETPETAGALNLGLTTETVVEVAAGANHSCARLDTGEVRCWGTASSGQLGMGNTTTVTGASTAVSVDLGVGRTATAVRAGGNTTCALLDNDEVKCWGAGSSGQLGIVGVSVIGTSDTPADHPGITLSGTPADVQMGSTHVCALHANGDVDCWGAGGSGQNGSGTTSNVGSAETPASVGPVSIGASSTQVAAGDEQSCAIIDPGVPKCWGLGNGTGVLGLTTNPTYIGRTDVPNDHPPISLE